MNASIEALLELAPPDTLSLWTMQAALASFACNADVLEEVMAGADAYIAWLDTLPTRRVR